MKENISGRDKKEAAPAWLVALNTVLAVLICIMVLLFAARVLNIPLGSFLEGGTKQAAVLPDDGTSDVMMNQTVLAKPDSAEQSNKEELDVGRRDDEGSDKEENEDETASVEIVEMG